MKPVSDRRREDNQERRRRIEQKWGRYPPCLAGSILRDVAGTPRCDKNAVDAHEILFRSRGGSITDLDNIIPVCRPCHDWIGGHSTEAEAVGLARSRYA